MHLMIQHMATLSGFIRARSVFLDALFVETDVGLVFLFVCVCTSCSFPVCNVTCNKKSKV